MTETWTLRGELTLSCSCTVMTAVPLAPLAVW